MSHCLCCFPVLIPKEKPPITVVGDVGGRIAIIVVRDDAQFLNFGMSMKTICQIYPLENA